MSVRNLCFAAANCAMKPIRIFSRSSHSNQVDSNQTKRSTAGINDLNITIDRYLDDAPEIVREVVLLYFYERVDIGSISRLMSTSRP